MSFTVDADSLVTLIIWLPYPKQYVTDNLGLWQDCAYISYESPLSRATCYSCMTSGPLSDVLISVLDVISAKTLTLQVGAKPNISGYLCVKLIK